MRLLQERDEAREELQELRRQTRVTRTHELEAQHAELLSEVHRLRSIVAATTHRSRTIESECTARLQQAKTQFRAMARERAQCICQESGRRHVSRKPVGAARGFAPPPEHCRQKGEQAVMQQARAVRGACEVLLACCRASLSDEAPSGRARRIPRQDALQVLDFVSSSVTSCAFLPLVTLCPAPSTQHF